MKLPYKNKRYRQKMSRKSKGNFIALIDGDILLYRSSAACEHTRYTYTVEGVEGDRFSRKTITVDSVAEARKILGDSIKNATRTTSFSIDPPEAALYNIRSTLNYIKDQTKCSDMRIYIDGPGNFRRDAFPEYKEGRPPKPKYYQICRDYLVSEYNAELIVNQEVDDKLAQEQDSNTVICSIDKDLYQVPGLYYNWVTDNWYYHDEAEANEWFWTQMLTGDAVDNIPGIDGVGLVTATKLLDIFEGDLNQMRGFVEGMYIEQFGDNAQFYMNLRLLYIRRKDHESTVSAILSAVT